LAVVVGIGVVLLLARPPHTVRLAAGAEGGEYSSSPSNSAMSSLGAGSAYRARDRRLDRARRVAARRHG
jgi:hypothetical protein